LPIEILQKLGLTQIWSVPKIFGIQVMTTTFLIREQSLLSG